MINYYYESGRCILNKCVNALSYLAYQIDLGHKFDWIQVQSQHYWPGFLLNYDYARSTMECNVFTLVCLFTRVGRDTSCPGSVCGGSIGMSWPDTVFGWGVSWQGNPSPLLARPGAGGVPWPGDLTMIRT